MPDENIVGVEECNVYEKKTRWLDKAQEIHVLMVLVTAVSVKL